MGYLTMPMEQNLYYNITISSKRQWVNSLSHHTFDCDFKYANFKKNLCIDLLIIQVNNALKWMLEDLILMVSQH